MTDQRLIQQFPRDYATQLDHQFFEIEELGAVGWSIRAVKLVGQVFGDPDEVSLMGGHFGPCDEFASHP